MQLLLLEIPVEISKYPTIAKGRAHPSALTSSSLTWTRGLLARGFRFDSTGSAALSAAIDASMRKPRNVDIQLS